MLVAIAPGYRAAMAAASRPALAPNGSLASHRPPTAKTRTRAHGTAPKNGGIRPYRAEYPRQHERVAGRLGRHFGRESSYALGNRLTEYPVALAVAEDKRFIKPRLPPPGRAEPQHERKEQEKGELLGGGDHP